MKIVPRRKNIFEWYTELTPLIDFDFSWSNYNVSLLERCYNKGLSAKCTYELIKETYISIQNNIILK